MHTPILLTLLTIVLPSTSSLICTQFVPFARIEHVTNNVTGPDQNPLPPFRISSIQDCTSSNSGLPEKSCNATSCMLTSTVNQLIRADRALNLTLPETQADQIFDLVKPYMPVSTYPGFGKSWVYQITGASALCFNVGQSAYFTFMPFYSCVVGRLSGCKEEGDVVNGTVVQVCEVSVVEGTEGYQVPWVWGEVDVVRGPPGGATGPPENATLSDEQGRIQSGATRVFGGASVCGVVVVAVLGVLGFESLL